MKKVAIIIPFKNEREEQLALGLSTINLQMGVDFKEIEVVLVNDGGQPIDLDKFELFTNLSINYFEIENVGPGLARQYGIDHSDSEYIMFIDADDMLYHGSSLKEFFEAVAKKRHDVVLARYIEQGKNEQGNEGFTPHPLSEKKAVYAKWYKRKHLEKNNIRFHPELRVMEDTYFVPLAVETAKDPLYLDKFVYVWLHNDDSLNRNPQTSFKSDLHTLVKANRLRMEWYREHKPSFIQNSTTDFGTNFLLMMYSMYKEQDPTDEEAFWQEQQAFVQDFASLMPKYSPVLQKMVDIAKNSDETKPKTDTSDFEDFVKKSWGE
ncbi:MAG: glycosyltransferase family 2 protein [Streptococcaceae bacterium]|jgi:glycosyltransferase involved in cell wall biosynthesis|nr:glycosyltransferase family 2 protein [Streptococcaceae bacterium]